MAKRTESRGFLQDLMMHVSLRYSWHLSDQQSTSRGVLAEAADRDLRQTVHEMVDGIFMRTRLRLRMQHLPMRMDMCTSSLKKILNTLIGTNGVHISQ